MIKKILIANRGEIAVRIIRTCKKMGIKTVALCPKKGEESNFVETSLADEYYFLEREGAQGYLDIKRILEIAKKAKVDAIHPGYGFLAENWLFAKLCQKLKIKFIGPHHSVLKKLEDKIEAKKIAKKLGIPVLPGSDSSIKSLKDLRKWILKIHRPFVLKARRGGAGIGIRVVNDEITIGEIFTLALGIKRQMSFAFSDQEFFLERYLPQAKHIEVQIVGDGENFLHFGERECTIQRRFQKLLEEAPSPSIEEKEREKIFDFALRIAKELKYETVGTVEFLMDAERNFYFLEINPRIQVEHPVTEAICGIDLVGLQIRICQGEKLKLGQSDISFDGWAIEARINAEDPLENFKPCPGKVEKFLPPKGEGIFVHTFLKDGQEILPYFDPLLVKIVVHGKTRQDAILKLKSALKQTKIEGIKTNIAFFEAVLEEEDFLKGNFRADFIEKSKILEKLKISEICKLPLARVEISEKELAEIVFKIYSALKEKSIPKVEQKISPWQLAERLKLFEQ